MMRLVLVVAGTASAFPVLSGLQSELAAKFPGFGASAIREAMLNGLQMATANEGLPLNVATCARNFATCPISWTSNGGACMPPAGYAGQCDSMELSGKTPSELATEAHSCDAMFPCMDAAGFSECPAGWSTHGDMCMAPASYSGPCVSSIKFPLMRDDQKAKYELVCGVTFGQTSFLRYTSANHPYAAGNANFPQADGGFGLETEKALPTVHVKYQFNAAASDPLNALRKMEARLSARRAMSASFLKGQVDDAIAGAQKAAQVTDTIPTMPSTMHDVVQGMRMAARPSKGGVALIDPNVEVA